jgi:hypothetical protein
VDLSHLTTDSYKFLFDDSSSDNISDEDSTVNGGTPVPLEHVTVKLEAGKNNDATDSEVEQITTAATTARRCVRWDIAGPSAMPDSLIPPARSDISETLPEHPVYSPTHFEYRNRQYYRNLALVEAEDRDLDNIMRDSPFDWSRCRFCHNTGMCNHCSETNNDIWLYRENRRLQSRQATSQSILLLLESHIRQLRNEGGPEETLAFIGKALTTIQAHRRLIQDSMAHVADQPRPTVFTPEYLARVAAMDKE